ncbi:DUF2313 domain-containing protein [Eubacterium sp. AF17-7]|jgi:hypothetical protein|uniref:putative phage tail protein n=1 Tax=Eubacterium sp. AF17-7 TaxID=2293105 RepID=UPI000E4E556F|nr:putative phage tail protein [Eubacterium sp. AF17-7]RGG63413.1 DUF2313 domain-containing protein [Eubacterium sp. AF17-7]
MDNNERILGINEIRELYAVNDLQESELEQQIDEAEQNMQISSMDINMCRITEKEMGLKGQDNDTVEEKRFRILGMENEQTPYTISTLKRRLEQIVGSGMVDVSISNSTVKVRVALIQKKMIDYVKNILEDIVPLDMLIDADVMWNTHQMLKQKTYAQLKEHSHRELKEGELN